MEIGWGKKSRHLNYSGNCFIFRCNTGYLVREVLWKIFFPILAPCPLIISSSYWWSRNVNRNKTLAKLSCQLSNFLEWIETSFWLRREFLMQHPMYQSCLWTKEQHNVWPPDFGGGCACWKQIRDLLLRPGLDLQGFGGSEKRGIRW